MQRCTERVYIVRFRCCKFANGHIKAMHEIHKLILRKALEQVLLWIYPLDSCKTDELRYILVLAYLCATVDPY